MANPIEEFLIHLGFRVDEHSWRTFTGALVKSTVAVERLGFVAAGAAVAVTGAVDIIARRYEQLYYASQRTGASAGALMSYSFAATQIGLSSEAARQSVDAFAQSLRLNPGLQGLLMNLGVGPGDTTQRMVGMVAQLKARFGEKGYFAAARVAGLFGMGETEFRHMWMNLDRLIASQTEQQRRLRNAGIDADAAAKKFTDFSRALNSLGAAFEALGDRIALGFVDPVQKGVEGVTRLIDAASMAVNQGMTSQASTQAARTNLPGTFNWIYNLANRTEGVDYAHGGKTPAAQAAIRDKAVQFFMAQGWTRAQAVGIAANLQMESGLDPHSENRLGMYGLAQWDKERRGNFAKWAGHSIQASTLDEQLAFIQHELTAGGEQRAGRMLRGATGPIQAGRAFSMFYERPGSEMFNAYRRGALANTWFGQGVGGGATITQNNHITVNGVQDPQTAASKITEGMDLKNQQLRQMIRGDTVR